MTDSVSDPAGRYADPDFQGTDEFRAAEAHLVAHFDEAAQGFFGWDSLGPVLQRAAEGVSYTMLEPVCVSANDMKLAA